MKEPINHDPISVGGRERVAILAIHGFTGSPWSMRPLAEFFAQRGFAVEMPRLPGHGSKWQDMLQVSKDDWLAEVDAAYWRLRSAGHPVVVIGLSMGGMLAIRQSARRPVLGTVLINPFVKDPTVKLRLAKFFSYFIETTAGITSDIALPDVDEGGYKRVPMLAAHQLYLLGKETRPMLPSLQAPVLYFRSRTDHVVSDSSHHLFLKRVSCPLDFVQLNRSFHVATLDYDADIIVKESLDFVTHLGRNLEERI